MNDEGKVRKKKVRPSEFYNEAGSDLVTKAKLIKAQMIKVYNMGSNKRNT